jgi:hypothetical protein
MRILGFILILSLTFLNLATKRRLPPIHVSGGLFNLKAFKYPPFSIYTASSFISFLGLYTGTFEQSESCLGFVAFACNLSLLTDNFSFVSVLTYIDLSATSAGIDPSFDVYFLAIANASSFIGRISSGYLADRVGKSSHALFWHCRGTVRTDSTRYFRMPQYHDPHHVISGSNYIRLAFCAFCGIVNRGRFHIRVRHLLLPPDHLLTSSLILQYLLGSLRSSSSCASYSHGRSRRCRSSFGDAIYDHVCCCFVRSADFGGNRSTDGRI